MIKPSKYLLTFAGLFVLLGSGVLMASRKFLPLLFQHPVYYCQSVLHSFSLHLPDGLGVVLMGLLLLLMGYSAIKLMAVYIKINSMRKRLHLQIQTNKFFEQSLEQLHLTGQAFLVNDHKPFAFCHGIRNPKIYFSTALFNMVNASELEAILRHEQYHLKYKDSSIMLLAEVVKTLFPFFPLLTDLIRSFRIEREIAADYQAVSSLGTSESLISVLKKLLLYEQLEEYAFAPNLADFETLEVRIKALTNKNVHFRKLNLLNTLVSIASIGIFATLTMAPIQAIEIHDQKHDVMIMCLTNDQCVRGCQDNYNVNPMTLAPNASYVSTPVAALH